MTHITIHNDLIQGSDEWLAARCGLLTASEMKLIITPTLKIASNEKERAHLYELMAQRLTKYVEPHYISDDMLRGHEDEILARADYERVHGPVQQVGFVTNSKWGFTIGYSPDGLVGEDGQIECKSRRYKYQVQTIIENVRSKTSPVEYMLQNQTGLLVTERSWCDFLSRAGGLPMPIIRVYPDPIVQEAIVNAAGKFERRIAEKIALYQEIVAEAGMIETERKVEEEMYV